MQDIPSTNHEVDMVSQKSMKSHSQRSAFKPIIKKRGSDHKSEAPLALGGVTKSSEKLGVEKQTSLAQFGNDPTPASNCSNA